jgi:peroxiredoxin
MAFALFAAASAWPFAVSAAELQRWPGKTPPAFTLASSDGTDIALNAHRRPAVLVHFFATWCEPCREEFPALRRLVERNKTDVQVLAISVAEADPRVRKFLQTMPVNFPVLLDRDRAVAKAWNVTTLPTTILLDETLQARLVVESDFRWDEIEPAQLIDMLAAKTAPQVSAKTETAITK